ncbi:MAG: ethylbenzene dehydrogenase-related protein [Desulfobacterales bacterium]
MKMVPIVWRGSIVVFLVMLLFPAGVLGGPHRSPTVLTAVKTRGSITVDGIADEAEWGKSPPLTIQIKDGSIGNVTVTMKALYDDALYLLIRWADKNADRTKSQWVFDDDENRWVSLLMSDPLKQEAIVDEDKFAVIWNINDSIDGFNIAGCAMLCHGDRMHTNDPQERADTWYWKASRTNPLGYADDHWFDDGVGAGFDEEAREIAHRDDRRDEDAGIDGMRGSTHENLHYIPVGEETVPAPWYWEPGATGDDAYSITQEEIINGEAVEIKDPLSISRQDPIPGYILFRPKGSGGDIGAKGVWDNGIWTLEIKRQLITGNNDDVQFDTSKLYRFGIAIHDNSSGFGGYGLGHSFDLGARTLEFGGTGSEQVTAMVLVQDYLLTGLTYSRKKMAGQALSQINLGLAVFNEVQQAVADLDPKLFIDIKSRFVTAKRTLSPESTEALIRNIDNAILLLQGKIEPSKESWSLRLLSWWGNVQAYIFIILGLLALIPISRSTRIMKKEQFRAMGGFLFVMMAPILLESLGRIGMLTRIRPLQSLSFMTNEYASFAWVLIVLFALYMARKGFTELDAVIVALQKAHDQLESRVAERTAELAEALDTMRLEITERQRVATALRESEIRLHDLSSHLLTAQETERRRVSLELHDELGQSLTVLKLQLRSIERQLPEDQETRKAECEEALAFIDQILENVRRLSRDLSPSIIEDLGLTAALRWLTDEFARHANIVISPEIPDIDALFSPDAQIMLYRLFQEALTNIGKHAEAKHVAARIEKAEGEVSFLIEDDGRGFDLHQVMSRGPSERSMGLAAMNERARMLGGDLEIHTEVGEGTRISLTVPIYQGGI